MKTTAVPLDHLAQRIAQQQSELETLRREYEARQARLADLERRKEALEAQLRQVQAEIQTVDQGETPTLPSKSGKTGSTPTPALVPPVKAVRPETLAEFLLGVMRGTSSPLTVRQLADEVVRRKFPTTSKNIPNLVKSQVSKLVAQGVFQGAKGQPGVVLAEAKGKPKTPATRPQMGVGSKNGTKAAGSAKKTAPPRAAGAKKPSLRSILTDLLAGSKEPVAVRDLAAQAKARGYRTKSKSFKDVVWVMLGHMDNVENVPGQGYRLKKR